MIDLFEEAVRAILVKDLPVQGSDIDISFHQPKREWSARVNRPTLNVFLYDVRENNTLRQWGAVNTERGNGQYRREFAPRRMDLQYIVTAWSAEPDDEHRLLSRALMALLRHPELPNARFERDRLPEGLREQPMPIPLKVAQPDTLKSPSDLWSALDNEIRPAISLVATLAFDPNEVETGPVVRARAVALGQASEPRERKRLDAPETADRSWQIGGTIRSSHAAKPVPEGEWVTLAERGERFKVDAEGRFKIGGLVPGTYTLIIEVPDFPPARRVVVVTEQGPVEAVDIEL